MSLTNSGTGLKPIVSSSGLKLSSSPFTTLPDDKIAAVDVYKLENSGVINSISEASETDTGFFDKIKNAVSTGISNLIPKIPTTLGTELSTLDKIKGGVTGVMALTRTASGAMSAINQIKNGGINGKGNILSKINGISSGANSLIRLTTSRGGELSNSLLSNLGAINGLSSNISTLSRSVSYLEKAGTSLSKGGSIDSILRTTSSSLSVLDSASKIKFTEGFNSVFSKTNTETNSYNTNASSIVRSTSLDFTSSFNLPGPFSKPARAGTTVGLATISADYGDNTMYSDICNSGLDKDSAFIAGTALTNHSTKTGNLDLLKDLASVTSGLSAVTANSKTLFNLVTNLKPSSNQFKRPIASVFDDIENLSTSTGQLWNKTKRKGSTILDTTSVQSNPYALEVVSAKARQDNLNARYADSENEKPDDAITISNAQAMMASNSVLFKKYYSNNKKSITTSSTIAPEKPVSPDFDEIRFI